MSHMQAQIIGPQDWWEVETTQGTFWVQCEDVGYKDVLATDLLTYLSVPDTSSIMRWEFKSGYGARLSAPGYTDCTDWCVFDTETEAREYLFTAWDICPACLDSRQDDVSCQCLEALDREVWEEAVVDRAINRLTMGEIVSIEGVYEKLLEVLRHDVIEVLGEQVIKEWRERVKSNTEG